MNESFAASSDNPATESLLGVGAGGVDAFQLARSEEPDVMATSDLRRCMNCGPALSRETYKVGDDGVRMQAESYCCGAQIPMRPMVSGAIPTRHVNYGWASTGVHSMKWVVADVLLSLGLLAVDISHVTSTGMQSSLIVVSAIVLMFLVMRFGFGSTSLPAGICILLSALPTRLWWSGLLLGPALFAGWAVDKRPIFGVGSWATMGVSTVVMEVEKQASALGALMRDMLNARGIRLDRSVVHDPESHFVHSIKESLRTCGCVPMGMSFVHIARHHLYIVVQRAFWNLAALRTQFTYATTLRRVHWTGLSRGPSVTTGQALFASLCVWVFASYLGFGKGNFGGVSSNADAEDAGGGSGSGIHTICEGGDCYDAYDAEGLSPTPFFIVLAVGHAFVVVWWVMSRRTSVHFGISGADVGAIMVNTKGTRQGHIVQRFVWASHTGYDTPPVAQHAWAHELCTCTSLTEHAMVLYNDRVSIFSHHTYCCGLFSMAHSCTALLTDINSVYVHGSSYFVLVLVLGSIFMVSILTLLIAGGGQVVPVPILLLYVAIWIAVLVYFWFKRPMHITIDVSPSSITGSPLIIQFNAPPGVSAESVRDTLWRQVKAARHHDKHGPPGPPPYENVSPEVAGVIGIANDMSEKAFPGFGALLGSGMAQYPETADEDGHANDDSRNIAGVANASATERSRRHDGGEGGGGGGGGGGAAGMPVVSAAPAPVATAPPPAGPVPPPARFYDVYGAPPAAAAGASAAAGAPSAADAADPVKVEAVSVPVP